jgi:hypothetical protein
MGSIARCLLDDASFEELFRGLRPAGWTSDGGQAFTRALLGGWRSTSSAGIQQLTFRVNGRYDRDLGSSARVGVSERTSATATGGQFTLSGAELTLVPDHRPTSRDRYFVRVFEEWSLGAWRASMVLVDSLAKPPNVVQYYRQ